MKYPYLVRQMQVDEHLFWVAECPSLKGCIGQGDTQEEAVAELELNEAEWLKTAEEYGIEIPPIPVEQLETYSGKFVVRISPAEHRKATECAKHLGISLNQYVNDAIVSRNAEQTVLGRLSKEVSHFASTIADRVAGQVHSMLFSGTANSRTEGSLLNLPSEYQPAFFSFLPANQNLN